MLNFAGVTSTLVFMPTKFREQHGTLNRYPLCNLIHVEYWIVLNETNTDVHMYT